MQRVHQDWYQFVCFCTGWNHDEIHAAVWERDVGQNEKMGQRHGKIRGLGMSARVWMRLFQYVQALLLFLLFFFGCSLDAEVARCLACKGSTTIMWRTCEGNRRQTSRWEEKMHSWSPSAESYCPTSRTALFSPAVNACLCQASYFSDTCHIGTWPYRLCHARFQASCVGFTVAVTPAFLVRWSGDNFCLNPVQSFLLGSSRISQVLCLDVLCYDVLWLYMKRRRDRLVLYIFTCCFAPVVNPSCYRKTCCEKCLDFFGIPKEGPTKTNFNNVSLQRQKLINLNASKINVKSLSCKTGKQIISNR